ncbi:MAG: NADH-quinone oxidoreductase subunit C [Candidatus Omnitrophota bacterium]
MDIKAKIKDRLGDKILLWEERSGTRIYFSVRKKDLIEAVKLLFRDLGLRLATASATDTPEGFEILYHFSFDETGQIFSIRVLLEDKAQPEVDSITPLFPGAEWIEREMWELMGINFKGHPNLKKLLLADDWPEGEYPLRKE